MTTPDIRRTDAMPEQCQTCGGYVADDSTPSWVFKAHEICECQHLHEYDEVVHSRPYISGVAWVCHACEVCSICNRFRCEVE